jgi:hypothetical protein
MDLASAEDVIERYVAQILITSVIAIAILVLVRVCVKLIWQLTPCR